MVVNLIINIIVGSIIAAPILWISGRMIVGGDNATFTDAFMISAIATAANYILGAFLGQEIGGLAQLFIYLYLVTKYYETGWVKAAIVAVVNVVLGIVIAYVMIMLGLAGMFV